MRTLTRSVERGHPGPRSTSRAQLRMSGLTPPPEGSSCRPFVRLLVRPPGTPTASAKCCRPLVRLLVRPLSSSPSASSPTFRMQFLGITFRADTKTAKYQRLIFNPSNTHRGIACEIVGNPQGGLVAATVSRSQAVRPTASAPHAGGHPPHTDTSRHPPPENAPPGNTTGAGSVGFSPTAARECSPGQPRIEPREPRHDPTRVRRHRQ